ncbi:MFS transporter [Planotetraspora mira]|uniref:ABC transporter permease n=1 Tax=Planotetraspora mira TaxID=58121 RepID=A0A8J3TWF9_9ACTN|nr:MFS transporter [Planotetraspora mira]GII33512.1 ABC transporter permease [Planotetraspora mira]
MANMQVRDIFWGRSARNVRLVVAARAVRTFGYGCTSVLLAGMLAEDGDAPWQIGLLLAAASAGSVASSLLLGLFADRWGRRRALIACGCLMAAAGVVFALSESFLALAAAAFVGTISPSTNDNTPFSGVEQSILAQSCEPSQHTRVFTIYNVTALVAGALGGLAAAILGLQHLVSAGDAAFALYAVLAAGTVTLFFRLSPEAEARAYPAPDTGTIGRPAARAPWRVPANIRRLAGLFAVDAFAGGLAVQTVLAWWFAHRYGATTAQLGLVFFAANLLPALAQLTAPLLAARRGLLAAMLVPHFASNLILACIPFAPSLGGAVALLLIRQALSKIDVPARQAFTAAVVDPEDRTAAASMTSIARSVAVSVSPLVATALLTGALAAIGAPLLLGAALAIGYDITVWRSYRSTPLGETA